MKRLFLVVGAVLCLSGCAVAVVGGAAAAGYVYVNGTLKGTIEASLPRAEQATRDAMAELDLVAVEGAADKLKAKLSARMADGTRVRIRLKAIDFETTAVHIRAGTLGDKAISQQILRHIRRELGLPPQ